VPTRVEDEVALEKSAKEPRGEEVYFTKGRIIVRGKLVTRGKAKKADFVLYYKPNIPIALIEAKDNPFSIGDGMQQALDYAETLKIPFVFSSNGDGFVFHDRTGAARRASRTSAWTPSRHPPTSGRAIAPGRARRRPRRSFFRTTTTTAAARPRATIR
jgi:type I site-specific restriction endonuclease